MSEAAHTPPTDVDASPPATHSSAGADLACTRCGHTLERSHVHASRARTQTSQQCLDCGFGAAAIVNRSAEEIANPHAKRIGRDQRRLPQNPSVDVLASFVDGTVPSGTYHVERTGNHEYRLHPPIALDPDALERMASRLRTPSTDVERSNGSLIVRDTRFVDPSDNTTWPPASQSNRPSDAPSSTADHELPQSGGSINGVDYGAEEARTDRARREAMDVALAEKGGLYEVHSESDNTYAVDILAGTCTCRDHSDVCKHQRRVDLELRAERIPRPDGRLP